MKKIILLLLTFALIGIAQADYETIWQASRGGTGQSTIAAAYNSFYESVVTTLGDIDYGGASGAPTRLQGNTTSTKNFLISTGSGGSATAPAWGTIVAGDVPTLNQNTTGNAATVTTNANLTGVITSTGNATATGAQTGTGNTFAMSASPTFTGTVGAAAITSTGIDTAASFVPTGSSIPSNGMYLSAANTLDFSTNGTNQINVDVNGNMTIGSQYEASSLVVNSNTYPTISAVSSASDGARISLNSTYSQGREYSFKSYPGTQTFQIYDATSTSTPLAVYGGSSSTTGSWVSLISGGVLGWSSSSQYADVAIDTGLSRDSAGVLDIGNGSQGNKSGTINANTIKQNGNQVYSAVGTGLSASTNTVSSNAAYFLDFQPGLMATILTSTSDYSKVSKASTVDNITGSSLSLTCTTNPTITMYECGTSTTCASPTTIGSVTVTTTGTATAGTVSSGVITAGDYVAWAITAGTCTSLDISVTAQVHSN